MFGVDNFFLDILEKNDSKASLKLADLGVGSGLPPPWLSKFLESSISCSFDSIDDLGLVGFTLGGRLNNSEPVSRHGTGTWAICSVDEGRKARGDGRRAEGLELRELTAEPELASIAVSRRERGPLWYSLSPDPERRLL